MFFGRESELDQLGSLWRKRVSSLVTCRGRRRVGKSALIGEFARRTDARFIKIEGKRPEKGWSNATELQAFADQLAAQTGAETTPPSNWLNAFIRLSDKIPDNKKTVVLLDEISWLGYRAKNGTLVPARIELGVVAALFCVILVWILLKYIRLGRNFYAIGGNQQSALMLGINVKRTRFMSYVLSGLLSGLAGYVFMMHTGAGNATNAAGMEMNAIASSIIGGTLLTGGVGNVIGTFFGTLSLTTIKKIVVSSGLNDPWWQSITTGGMLCFFILLQSVVLGRRQKKAKT